MYYSYVEIEYVATSFSPARLDLALKLLNKKCQSSSCVLLWEYSIYWVFTNKEIVPSMFLVLSWLVVIVPSGLWQARGQRTDEGVTWPCLNSDPEVGWLYVWSQLANWPIKIKNFADIKKMRHYVGWVFSVCNLSFWRETSQRLCTLIVDRPTDDRWPTRRPTGRRGIKIQPWWGTAALTPH